MRRLSLTSWSVHHSLTDGSLTLLELPAQMWDAGIGTLEICHFHFPSTDEGYIGELRGSLERAGVEPFSFYNSNRFAISALRSCTLLR